MQKRNRVNNMAVHPVLVHQSAMNSSQLLDNVQSHEASQDHTWYVARVDVAPVFYLP